MIMCSPCDLRLYIMDGVISLPIALAAFFVIPDFPHNSRVWYINDQVRLLTPYPCDALPNGGLLQDKEIAARRMKLEQRVVAGPYTKAKVFSILSSWRLYLLPLLFL